MKRIFSKIITIALIISAVSAVSGFCQGMLLGGKAVSGMVAQAMTNNQDNIIAAEDNCGDEQNFLSPAQNQFLTLGQEPTKTQFLALAKQSVPTQSISSDSLPMHHSNSVMSCCLVGNSISTLTASRQFDHINIFAIILNSSEHKFAVVNKFEQPRLPILPPPEQLALSTINIRI